MFSMGLGTRALKKPSKEMKLSDSVDSKVAPCSREMTEEAVKGDETPP